jgi:hypothetical protein
LERAVARAEGATIIVLSAGTPHKAPPLDRRGRPVLECEAEARYLLKQGWDARNILMENASYDTIGNAYFSRVVHIEPRSLRRILIVTSEFHMARTEAVFRWVYGLTPTRHDYELVFEATPNDGLEGAALEARRTKEAKSLAGIAKLSQSIVTLAEFHAWLFEKHDVYRARMEEGPGPEDEALLRSY